MVCCRNEGPEELVFCLELIGNALFSGMLPGMKAIRCKRMNLQKINEGRVL